MLADFEVQDVGPVGQDAAPSLPLPAWVDAMGPVAPVPTATLPYAELAPPPPPPAPAVVYAPPAVQVLFSSDPGPAPAPAAPLAPDLVNQIDAYYAAEPIPFYNPVPFTQGPTTYLPEWQTNGPVGDAADGSPPSLISYVKWNTADLSNPASTGQLYSPTGDFQGVTKYDNGGIDPLPLFLLAAGSLFSLGGAAALFGDAGATAATSSTITAAPGDGFIFNPAIDSQTANVAIDQVGGNAVAAYTDAAIPSTTISTWAPPNVFDVPSMFNPAIDSQTANVAIDQVGGNAVAAYTDAAIPSTTISTWAPPNVFDVPSVFNPAIDSQTANVAIDQAGGDALSGYVDAPLQTPTISNFTPTPALPSLPSLPPGVTKIATGLLTSLLGTPTPTAPPRPVTPVPTVRPTPSNPPPPVRTSVTNVPSLVSTLFAPPAVPVGKPLVSVRDTNPPNNPIVRAPLSTAPRPSAAAVAPSALPGWLLAVGAVLGGYILLKA